MHQLCMDECNEIFGGSVIKFEDENNVLYYTTKVIEEEQKAALVFGVNYEHLKEIDIKQLGKFYSKDVVVESLEQLNRELFEDVFYKCRQLQQEDIDENSIWDNYVRVI